MKKNATPLQVALNIIREASLEDCRQLNDQLFYRMEHFRFEAKRALHKGDVVSFDSKRGLNYVGAVTEINRTRAIVGVPSYGLFSVPVTRLVAATADQVATYRQNEKMYGVPPPRPRRKSRDRKLLEDILGIPRDMR